MTNKAEETKTRILAAALVVLDRGGVRALTLDHVAKEAKLSKGGLTHHFKSKQDLALGLIDNVLAEMAAKLEVLLSQEPANAPGRFTRAYVRANLESIQCGEVESLRGLVEMLLAAPELVALRRQELLKIHERLNDDGIDKILAQTIAAASDGCWTNVIFGFYPNDHPIIEPIHKYLLDLSHPKRKKT